MWVIINTLAMKFPGGRAQGSLEFISDQLGRGKAEKSAIKAGATPKKVSSLGVPWWGDGGRSF